MSAANIDFLLAFADDEHLIGQQHTEWIGIAPFLEEDLAFSSIGQDELGHAVMLYELVLELQGIDATDAAIDALAYRSATGYRSSGFVEYPTSDWAEALVRHWIYDTVEVHRWTLVAGSTSEALRAIAASALREETYHRRHANALLDSLLPEPSARERLHTALDAILPMVPGLLTPTAGEEEALANGFVTGSTADLFDEVANEISLRFDRDTTLDSAPYEARARDHRSVYFAPLMARMREVLDLDPRAIW